MLFGYLQCQKFCPPVSLKLFGMCIVRTDKCSDMMFNLCGKVGCIAQSSIVVDENICVAQKHSKRLPLMMQKHLFP